MFYTKSIKSILNNKLKCGVILSVDVNLHLPVEARRGDLAAPRVFAEIQSQQKV